MKAKDTKEDDQVQQKNIPKAPKESRIHTELQKISKFYYLYMFSSNFIIIL